MGKCPVAERGPGNGGEPAIEYRELCCQTVQDGQVVGAILTKSGGHIMGRWHVRLLLLLVDANESVHGWRARGTRIPIENLVIDRGKVVVRVGRQLPAKLSPLLNGDHCTG